MIQGAFQLQQWVDYIFLKDTGVEPKGKKIAMQIQG